MSIFLEIQFVPSFLQRARACGSFFMSRLYNFLCSCTSGRQLWLHPEWFLEDHSPPRLSPSEDVHLHTALQYSADGSMLFSTSHTGCKAMFQSILPARNQATVRTHSNPPRLQGRWQQAWTSRERRHYSKSRSRDSHLREVLLPPSVGDVAARYVRMWVPEDILPVLAMLGVRSELPQGLLEVVLDIGVSEHPLGCTDASAVVVVIAVKIDVGCRSGVLQASAWTCSSWLS